MSGCQTRETEPGVFLGQSKGMCRECRQLVDARYLSDGEAVFLQTLCPQHGEEKAMVAESLSWYLDALAAPIAERPPPKVIAREGQSCPKACGPCEFHSQECNLPVFSITNACDLRCPICFTYNRADQTYFMSPEEFGKHIDYVVDVTGGVDLVNITGGEPTLHPQLFDLLALAKRPEIGRITLNSNGITIAENPELAKRLAEEDIYLILSLNTMDSGRSRALHGKDLTALKAKTLEALARYNVQTTLLMVLTGNVNEDEVSTLVDLALTSDFVRSLTIQTMTYTGQGGGNFGPRKHISVDGVERRIEEATKGLVRQADFLPLPTAHPLCYGVSYLFLDSQGKPHSLAALLGKDVLAKHLMDGYLLHPSSALEQELHAAIDRLWSQEESPELLQAVKEMLRTLYPKDQTLTVHERQRRAEHAVKTIYVHAHMDESTYEVGRAMRCPDQVPVNAERLVGACNYNLFYRMKDERFWVEK